jgi:putative glutamine amidotransferase
MRIGLSYDQGTAKYALYERALLDAAQRARVEVEAIWLAGQEQPLDIQALRTVDGIVLTGGADVEPDRYGFHDPEHLCTTFPGRDRVELEIIQEMFQRMLPTLAICRGMQLLNVACGGTLIPHLPPTAVPHQLDDTVRHMVWIEYGSQLARTIGTTTGGVTSSHHQAVDRVGDGLRVVARAKDRTIEAIEWSTPETKPWLAAVQWHPERMNPGEAFGESLYAGLFNAIASRPR